MAVLRDVLGLVALVLGAALVVVAMVAAGWWGLVMLGGSALACLGLGAVMHRVPEEGDGDDVTSPSQGG